MELSDVPGNDSRHDKRREKMNVLLHGRASEQGRERERDRGKERDRERAFCSAAGRR